MPSGLHAFQRRVCVHNYALSTKLIFIRDLVSRTQQQLKDQGINADNKIFHSPNARPGAVDPIEDSFRRKIPFLLFVNRGGSYMFDLQIILPISSATSMFRLVFLSNCFF